METKGAKELDGIVGRSAAMLALADMVLKVAPHDYTVLIYGESGTGKELIARSIQRNSLRANRPFLPVNCGAIPESLLEAHLFGHQKGSFTGASSDKLGLFEAASGGTIFLDEVGEMPLLMQVKLLRVLQEKEVVRVGATKPTKIDVRLIAATNRDLVAMIKDGLFRQDLYYRIAALEIEVPPLRKRREDIPLLARHFLENFRPQDEDKSPPELDRSALELLTIYDWPGNVRQLENLVNRLSVLTQSSRITAEDVKSVLRGHSCQFETDPAELAAQGETKLALPVSILELAECETMAGYLKRVKREVPQTAMAQYSDRTAVAERLGLAEDTVRKRVRNLRQSGTRPK